MVVILIPYIIRNVNFKSNKGKSQRSTKIEAQEAFIQHYKVCMLKFSKLLTSNHYVVKKLISVALKPVWNYFVI